MSIMRNMFRLSVLVMAWFMTAMASAQSGTIYRVSPAGAGTQDGSSWDNTMTLQAALAKAQAGAQIWVKGFEQITRSDQLYIAPEGGFVLKSGVQLYGGFEGIETRIEDRKTEGKPYQLSFRSVLSGDIQMNDEVDEINLIFPENSKRTDNATHVLCLNMDPQTSNNNNTYPTVVNGFSIGSGQADGTEEYGRGGGIYVYGNNTGGGIFRIERCFMVNNYAGQGGAIYVDEAVENVNNGESLISQCVVYNNAAGERSAVENRAGGIYLAGEATVVNTSIFNNKNGGVRISSGSKVVNATVARNTGAGIDLISAGTGYNVYNSIVWGNTLLSAEHRPGFKNSAFHEVVITDATAGADADGNIYVAKENRDENAGPMFDAPSLRTSFDREFNWRRTDYPLWSWNVLEGSVMLGKGDPGVYNKTIYGNEDMAGNARFDGSSIDIGAYEFVHLSASRVRYVMPTAQGTGDGSSWANASNDLQKMIDELANSGTQVGEVWVAAGTYEPLGRIISSAAYSASFRMRDGISVYGGFAGTETAKTQRQKKSGGMPWDYENETILKAAYYNHDDLEWINNKWTLTGESRHVVWFAPLANQTGFKNITTLDGVTVMGGYAQGGTGLDDFKTDCGGGVYINDVNAYLTNCIVKECYATGNGGGVYLKNGRVLTSQIYNCSSNANGGAIYVDNRGLVHRSMLANNSALNGAGVYLHNEVETGTGVEDYPEYLILSTCVVSNNTVLGNGAIYCDKGGVLLQNTVTNNNCITATDATNTDASQTAGIYIDEYALVVNTVIWNNQMGKVGNNNIPMYARNPSASTVRFMNNAISGVNNAVWNNMLQQQTLELVDLNAGSLDDGGSIGPRFIEPSELDITDFNLENDFGVQEKWKDELINYYWKPVDGANLWARGMTLGQLPTEVVLAPELDIEGAVFAQKPAIGAFHVNVPELSPSFERNGSNYKLVLYIDAECSEPSHGGASWATAFRSLNDALAFCAGLEKGTNVTGHFGNVSDFSVLVDDIDFFEFHVLEGNLWPRYAFTNNDPKTATVTVPATASGKPIHIYGGYHRTTDNNTVERAPLTYRSIINGNNEGKTVEDGLYHCITVEQNAEVMFDGFHVINGYAAGTASRQYGAGLLAHTGSDVTLRNCIFENNTAQESAAIDARGATLTMQNCVVNNNTNIDDTKPVVNAGTLTMEHVTVVNNIGKAPDNMGASSFSAGNTNSAGGLQDNNTLSLSSMGAEGAKNFANPTNNVGATLGFDTYLGGYSEFRPLTSSTDAGGLIINKVSDATGLSTDVTTVNSRDLGGIPDLGAYEADLPKKGRVYYVRTNGNDNNSGLSWDQAFATIRKAVTTAYEGTVENGEKPQVWVAAGTYSQAPQGGSDNCFEILDGVNVYGAFPKTGHPGMEERHPFISTSVYNNYDGIYSPDDYETILRPSTNSGNRRVLGQEDRYNPVKGAPSNVRYEYVGPGKGNYIYKENDEYQQVEAGKGNYIWSNGDELVSAAPNLCNYLKVEQNGYYQALDKTATHKYATTYDIQAYESLWSNLKNFVEVGSGYGEYSISKVWYGYTYTEQTGGGYSIFDSNKNYYEAAQNLATHSYCSTGDVIQVTPGTGNLLKTVNGYNEVGTGYGDYLLTPKGYQKVEAGMGDYMYLADNRFTYETVWDGFTLTSGYVDSDDLADITGDYARDGGAGARIFTSVKLQNCVVVANTNNASSYSNGNSGTQTRGGGVYCDEGTLVNCYIIKNTLGHSSQFTAYGGGCYMYNGTAYNCVISENVTNGYHGDGAGIFIENAVFYNNTIVKNTSNGTTRGNGGICIWTSGVSSQLTIYNCIVLGNSGIKGSMIGSGDIAVSSNGGYINCNYTISSSTTNASRNNGAVTYTNSVVRSTSIFADYANGNYRLGSMDGANMGLDAPTVNGETIYLSEYTDMDFTDRIKDCRVDAGAYERNNTDNTSAEVVGDTRIFYVTQNGSGTTAGNSVSNAACATKLQTILDAAGELKKLNPDFTVIVKIAGYSEDGSGFVYHVNTLADENDPQSYSYTIPYGIIVEGGYNDQDKDWSDAGSRDVMTNKTVFNAIKSATTTQQEINGYHVVTFAEKPEDWTGDIEQQTVIDGIWLEDGQATSMAGAGNPNTRGGGAIVPSGAHVRNCIVTNCSAIEGGGLYVMPGATVSGTLVMNNSAEEGGGIYADSTGVNKNTRAHILSCTIANNEASSIGGGLYMQDGALMTLNTVIFDNSASSDKNISGVNNMPYEDNKLAEVFKIDGKTYFYPFNCCFVETQEMPSDFENTSLNSDKTLYFADDYYRLKDYSVLVKHGIKNKTQESLITTFNVDTEDMQNILRIQKDIGAERIDAGAFAYLGGILPTATFKRIFVSPSTNIDLPEGENMLDYLGRSFYTSFSTLEDALGYVRSQRNDNNVSVNFEILVAAGTYKPTNLRTTDANLPYDQRLYSFEVPQGISIYGGFSGDELYCSGDLTAIPGIGQTFTNIEKESLDNILSQRSYSDFNQNNIYEPWELANQTILSGQINASATAKNAYHILFTEKDNSDNTGGVVLDGLTVMYGETSDALSTTADNNEQGRGGGIYSNGVTYSLSRCRLLNNVAVRGGAVFVRDADLNLSGCIFAGNKTVDNTAQETNTLTSRGGAVYISGINTTVSLRAVNTLWANNESAKEGGAIGTNYAEGISSVHDPYIDIMNNTFVRNKAATNPVLYNHNGKSRIMNTLIWGNEGKSYDDKTSVAEVYDVTYSASDVDYIGKFKASNLNHNVLLDNYNMGDKGPRFTNPSAKAGVEGNSASSLWNPAAISIVTDAGNGTEHTSIKPDGEDNHMENAINGGYNDWFDSNKMVKESYISEGIYSRYSGPRNLSNEELCKSIDIGLYEYQYISNFSTMPAIYVDVVSRGLASGNSWANATDDLRGAIVGAANPTQETHDRVIYIRDGDYSWSRLSAGAAYVLNMSDDKDLSNGLTLKGSCTGSGDQQDFSKPTVLRNAPDVTTANLLSVETNGKYVNIEGFTLINKSSGGTAMTASTGIDGTLTLKNCAFRMNQTGMDISSTGNQGTILVYNTLFADGGTGMNEADANTTVVNATFANNATDMIFASATSKPDVYNSVSWNNATNNMFYDSDESQKVYYNKIFDLSGTTPAENNADIYVGPNFVDPLNENPELRNYRIRPSLTLLNKGSNQNYLNFVKPTESVIPEGETDLANSARLVDDDIDIGAYEYEAALQPIVYVKAGLTGTADGKSWQTALGDLQGAVDLAGIYSNYFNLDSYVFVHNNYQFDDKLSLSLDKIKVYGNMNDEISSEDENTTVIVNELLGKRKGLLELENNSVLNDVTINSEGGVVDGFEVNGKVEINKGCLSTSIVNNNVTGKPDGVLYNSLILGDGTVKSGNVDGVKSVNVTAIGKIGNVQDSGNNRELAAGDNMYVPDDRWNYQLMETDDENIDKGIDDTTQACIDNVGHSRDLIGNQRIRNTVDNGCFETWNITSDTKVTADDRPIGKSVVYVRAGMELQIEADIYTDENAAFNPGYLLLEHEAGLRGNNNFIGLTNFAVERNVPAGGYDLAYMPFNITQVSQNVLGNPVTYQTYDGSIRAAYDYKYATANSTAWVDKAPENSMDMAFLLSNGGTDDAKVRFSGNSYTEDQDNKFISLIKYNFNEPWASANDGGNRFTHKENMSWNLFGSPYLCKMNYGDMQYGRVIYEYGAIDGEGTKGYMSKNTADEKVTGTIPSGAAVFTQTATLKDAETFTVNKPIIGSGNGEAGVNGLLVYLAPEEQTATDYIQLKAVPSEEALADYDISSDGVKWMNPDTLMAQIYMTRNGGRYSLLSALDIEGYINVGLQIPTAGRYRIGIDDEAWDDEYETVVLKDNETGRVVDLLEGAYAFQTTQSGAVEGRFSIAFNRMAAEKADSDIKLQALGGGKVRITGLVAGDRITAYNAAGVTEYTGVADNETVVINVQRGVCLVRINQTDGQETVRKTVVR